MKYSLLFLGTPHFAIPALERLHQEHNIVAVVTQPDKPVGRKQVLTAPPIKTKAEELGLTVLQPHKASEIPSLIHDRIDFIITAAYGEYLPKSVLTLPLKDALNIHPSLLPLYRGATPMQSALLNGDKKTGVSIIRMGKEMDAGPIFSQLQFPLPPEWKYPDLENKCAAVGAELISSVITNYHSMSPQDQNESHVSTCTKIEKKDGQINWSADSAEHIYNKLRALTPWPGVYTFWKEQKLNLLDFTSNEIKSEDTPGTVFQHEEGVFIRTTTGSLEIKELQLAGKKPSTAKAFLNGYSDFIGSSLT